MVEGESADQAGGFELKVDASCFDPAGAGWCSAPTDSLSPDDCLWLQTPESCLAAQWADPALGLGGCYWTGWECVPCDATALGEGTCVDHCVQPVPLDCADPEPIDGDGTYVGTTAGMPDVDRI